MNHSLHKNYYELLILSSDLYPEKKKGEKHT